MLVKFINRWIKFVATSLWVTAENKNGAENVKKDAGVHDECGQGKKSVPMEDIV